ncbi:hypothetical protein [Azospirillum thiophilum]|uniref:hypothetical protein n=1 Tax=Azospirillum thiophilum TaxID=528244 RepID=UPI0011873277|nr:hypothetical protein [Azospirillum thiophilum]
MFAQPRSLRGAVIGDDKMGIVADRLQVRGDVVKSTETVPKQCIGLFTETGGFQLGVFGIKAFQIGSIKGFNLDDPQILALCAHGRCHLSSHDGGRQVKPCSAPRPLAADHSDCQKGRQR